jgi:hypothetical protein
MGIAWWEHDPTVSGPLIRQLMERQALRRVDEGELTDDQIEGWLLPPDQ